MEILRDLLGGKEPTIETAAAAIVGLEIKLQGTKSRLEEAKEHLAKHHRNMALGKGDQKKGENLQQKVFFMEGEVTGLVEVLELGNKEAEIYAQDKIDDVKEERKALCDRASKEQDDVDQKILGLCCKLYVLIYKATGRKDGTLSIGMVKQKVPWPYVNGGVEAGVALQQQLGAEVDGPYFTGKEADGLLDWIKKATPRSVLLDALSEKRI